MTDTNNITNSEYMLMKRTIIACLLCLLCGSMAQAQKIRIKTGIEVLKEQNFKCLRGNA